MNIYPGSCLCGGIRFSVAGALPPIQICHCSQCRRAQGSAFAANLPIAEAAFELQAGADLVSAYASSPGKWRCFCRVCGSPLYSRRDSVPGVLRVRAGLLDVPLPTRIGFHFYMASKADWWPEGDVDVPRHPDGGPP